MPPWCLGVERHATVVIWLTAHMLGLSCQVCRVWSGWLAVLKVSEHAWRHHQASMQCLSVMEVCVKR
jgi:hypothetical protein